MLVAAACVGVVAFRVSSPRAAGVGERLSEQHHSDDSGKRGIFYNLESSVACRV